MKCSALLPLCKSLQDSNYVFESKWVLKESFQTMTFSSRISLPKCDHIKRETIFQGHLKHQISTRFSGSQGKKYTEQASFWPIRSTCRKSWPGNHSSSAQVRDRIWGGKKKRIWGKDQELQNPGPKDSRDHGSRACGIRTWKSPRCCPGGKTEWSNRGPS